MVIYSLYHPEFPFLEYWREVQWIVISDYGNRHLYQKLYPDLTLGHYICFTDKKIVENKRGYKGGKSIE